MAYFVVWLQKQIIRLAAMFIRSSKQKRKRFLKEKTTKAEKKYLSRYLEILDHPFPLPPAKCDGNCLFVCWWQGMEQAPDIVKKCIFNMKKYVTDREIVIITQQNINRYADIPQYIFEKHKQGKISNTQLSDIIRVCLLAQNGGMWIDSTVLLTAPLPDKIRQADFFAFHANYHLKNNSWLLSSRRSDLLMVNMRSLMLAYWKAENRQLNYFLYHLFFDLMTENNAPAAAQWAKTPVLWDTDCYDIEHNLLKTFDIGLWNKICAQTSVHKLNYKYDKHINIQNTFLEHVLKNA